MNNQLLTKTVKIKDLGKVITGTTPSTACKEYFDGNYLFIKPSDISEDQRYIFNTAMTLSDAGYELQKLKALPKNSVCVVCIGTIGKKMCLTYKTCFSNQQINSIVVNKSKYNAIYIYYLIRTYLPHLKQLNAGSTSGRENVNKTSFENIEIQVHQLETQNKIVSILSAYDDLIENNTRRIKILESMAQTLYQEWFVKFRFPGYKQVKMVESELGLIPEGWKVKELSELIDIKHGYAFKSKFYSKEPTSQILLTPGNFAIGGGYQDKKLKYYDGDVSKEFILDSGDLLVTMTDLSKLGDTLGYPAFVPASKELTYLHNQRLGKVLIKEDSQIGKQLLYYIFCSDSYRHHVLASATGSTVKHTAPIRIQSFKIALPSIEIRNKFESIADSFNSQVACLNQKNDNLRKTRDLLLPKLISGQIDVENLDIDTGELAA